jgi:predicted NUDIX family phosphoesterase
MTKKTELILAIRSAGLPAELLKTGFHRLSHMQCLNTLDAAGLFFGPRYLLEDMPDFRQVIPYIVLEQGGKVVFYERAVQGGEARLHGKVSVGLGGHTDVRDVKFADGNWVNLHRTLADAADRELDEELPGNSTTGKEVVGLIVDMGNEVGRVHIGVVMIATLCNDLSKLNPEDHLSSVGLETAQRLLSLDGVSLQLEPWTRLVLQSGLITVNANVAALEPVAHHPV